MKAVQCIAILIAVVSSTQLTFHQINETSGACMYIQYDEGECKKSLPNDLVADDYWGYTEGACPTTYSKAHCAASPDPSMAAEIIVKKVLLMFSCGRSDVTMDYDCIDPDTRNVIPQPKEIWHMSVEGACGYFEFDDAKCPGLKDKVESHRDYIPGPCPSSHLTTCDAEIQEELNLKEYKAQVDKLIDQRCEPDGATFNFLCADSRMKTFHQILDSGLCVYVDVDDKDCPDMEDFLMSEEQDYISGPCPDEYLQSHCDDTRKLEMKSVVYVFEKVLSSQCGWEEDELTFDYACEERPEMKCPAACAEAIASDASAGAAFINGDFEYEGFCATMETNTTEEIKFDLPEPCTEEMIPRCLGDIYEKCHPFSELLRCPYSDYGFPPLQNCHAKTCAEWKEATTTGCAKDLSHCIKDEAQGQLRCKKDGTPLPQPSKKYCTSQSQECAKGEFCDLDDGKCQMCSHTVCAIQSTEEAREECRARCGEDSCTPNHTCLATCSPKPKTCHQLRDEMESPTGCGKRCNQCVVDVFNEKLHCFGADKAHSRVDGNNPDPVGASASTLSILMLVFIAIYQF